MGTRPGRGAMGTRRPAGPLGNAARTEAGATLVEYALVLALVAVTCAGTLAYLGGAVNATLSQVAAQVAGGCTTGGGFQILVGGAGCAAEPWALTAALGQETIFQLTTAGGDVPVTYSCTGAGCSQFDLNRTTGSLQVLPGAPDGALPTVQVTATDSAGHIATTELAVVVAPTSLVAGLPVPAGAGCTSSGAPAYLQCTNGGWLDGYYLYTPGGWKLVAAGQGLPSWELNDTVALRDGTYQFGFVGAPAGPWTCSQAQGNGGCLAMSTNAPVGSVTHASPGALGIAG